MRVRRGEIRWAELDPVRGSEQGGRRPVLVVSQDLFNERSGTVIAMAITSRPQRAGLPLTMELSSPPLPRRSWVKISQIRLLAAERLGSLVAEASHEDMTRVIEALNEIVGD